MFIKVINVNALISKQIHLRRRCALVKLSLKTYNSTLANTKTVAYLGLEHVRCLIFTPPPQECVQVP